MTQPQKKEPNKKKSDPLKKIKLIAYRNVAGPEQGYPSYKEFINMARTYLAIQNNIPFKSPIWETYTEEELLIEYFCHVFMKFPDRRQKFEMEMGMGEDEYDSFLAFADKAIEKNQKELEGRADELPDSLSFTPDVLGDD